MLLGAALIAVAIVISNGNKTSNPAAAPRTSTQPTEVPTESTPTCNAWRTTSAAMDAIPPLPAGADFNTPNIDTLIANQKVAIEKALDVFESKIVANDPPRVVSAADGYIAAKRNDLAKLAAHTVTDADDTATDTSLATLDQVCGVKHR